MLEGVFRLICLPEVYLTEYHSADGLHSVSIMRGTGLTRDFILAGVELGLRKVDYNGAQQLGVSTTQANTLRGARHSVATAYLKPILSRPNLDVVTNTEAVKVRKHNHYFDFTER